MRNIVLAMMILAAPAGANPADGVYDAFDCTVPVSDQRVTLLGDRIVYYESSCRLTDPQIVEGWDNATLYWANCRGEGQDWRTRTMLMTRMGGDLIVVGNGWSERYAPCPNRKPELD
ncbi:hypothetical protein [Oceaniglobus indicus]|uniref:hypothetical protein n=1 Tax=Oceaniglobus indicus TaxID=2047749 RepID=UPI000C18BA68|nr:hypothetical protein [Oceaniglobus indicus]